MAVELWNEETGNLIDSFDTETEALREIRTVIARDGEHAIGAWALDRYDGRAMVRGKELIALARSAIRA
jgi:hypothetical protein